LQLTNNFKITDLKEVELDEMHHYIKKKWITFGSGSL
jgi:hypothetical protein